MIDVPIIHAVTDDAILARPDFLRRAGEVMEVLGASGAIHLRARQGGRALAGVARELMRLANTYGSRVVINDRLDVALAVGAWGLQLGSSAMTVGDALTVTARTQTVIKLGVSVHSAGGAGEAEGAYWLLAGNVFATPSHPGREGQGPDLVRRVSAAGIPVIAIGGVRPVDVADIRAAGAHGIAAISGIWNAPDPAAAARSYLEGFEV